MQYSEFETICKNLRRSVIAISNLNAKQKNDVLEYVAKSIAKSTSKIIIANQNDVENAKKRGASDEIIDRLIVNKDLINSQITSIDEIITYPEPINQLLDSWSLENGLEINKISFPLGVISIIYESRPAVSVDAFSLAFKSGNSILLRGSKTAICTNLAFFDAIVNGLKNACESLNLPKNITDCVYLMPESEDHIDVDMILSARGLIDCVLPRGGKNLIQNVIQNAKVPIIETGEGVCHLYVDSEADLSMAIEIIKNAKLQRPSVCNSLECVVIHKNISEKFLPILLNELDGKCELLLNDDENNYHKEWLGLKLSVKICNSLDDAIEFINLHNTKHSETIVTRNFATAAYFQSHIDAACVYHNASTRFTDGGQFGFGAELGISTQKLHVRGPMGIKTLTTYKYVINGNGQVRK